MMVQDFWQQVFIRPHVPAIRSFPPVSWSPPESAPVVATLWQRSSLGGPAFNDARLASGKVIRDETLMTDRGALLGPD